MVDDNPQDVVHDLAAEAVFGSHPLGRPVIGRAEVISSISRRSLLGYHQGAYVGPNVVLAAAGNVEHKRIVAALEAAPQRPRRSTPCARRASRPAGRRGRRSGSSARGPSSTTSASPGPGISRDDPRRYASALLDAILGGSASSRLFQEIREKRGMAYSVYTYGSQYVDAGQIGIYVGTREENLRECLDVIAAELQDVGAGNIRAGELERAKENMKGRLLLSLESTSARMTPARQGDRDRTPRSSRSRRPSGASRPSRAEEIAALARELYAPERLSAAGIGPSEKRFRAAVERINPDAVGARRMRILLFGREGKVGAVLMSALSAAGHDVDRRRGRGGGRRRAASTPRSTSRRRPPSTATRWRRSRPAFRA